MAAQTREAQRAELHATIFTHAIDASPTLCNKKDLIEAFVDRVAAVTAVDSGHGEKKRRVLAKLREFLERFLGLSSGHA